MKHFSKISATFCASLLLSNAAFSATDSDTFEVRVLVADSCEIVANDLDFGTYDPLDAVPLLSAISTIDVECTLLTPFDVGIDAGQNGTGVADRKMIKDGSTETLDYTLGCVLSLPVASAILTNCATNWGNSPGVLGVGGDTFFGLGLGTLVGPLPIVMSGTIALGQDVPTGTYRDNPVTATVTF
ncbi:Csu type fimbrial protein [Arenicella xantha]|uniref:Spore coat protein U-like protein n=1 Tax=Arenicella xantha TaxID=644221 RepID=A0A395JKA7_9GAMM|nr:spore coat U domain-containing protein [Arenicella xantha]RBP51206.1 spore coat protein U-like protein [Arenicella xantha]